MESVYISRLEEIIFQIQGAQKKIIVWEDVFNNGIKLSNGTIIQIWKTWDTYYNYKHTLGRITGHGYEAILSAPWYINYVEHGPWRKDTWLKYYEVDPHDFNGSDAQKELVTGGEACLWGEYINRYNLLPTLWPDASAVGERLWSPNYGVNEEEVKSRLHEHQCRMTMRGFPIGSTLGPGFCEI